MTKRTKLFLGVNGTLLVGFGLGRATGFDTLAALALGAVAVLVFFWLVNAFFRHFLWRVGRKLAFSYFLIGVVPIPLTVLLVAACAWVLSGALVGHIFRDTLESFHRDLETAAETALHLYLVGDETEPGDTTFAFYRGGQRIAGDPLAPEAWPGFLSDGQDGESTIHFLADDEDQLTYAVAVTRGDDGAVALFRGDFERTISERSGIWIHVQPVERAGADSGRIEVTLGERKLTLSNRTSQMRSEERSAFFGGQTVEGASTMANLPWTQRPYVVWAEPLGEAAETASPERTVELAAFLNASLATVQSQVVSGAAEVNAMAWGVLVAIAFLLFDIYAVAALMAVFMIFSLSRAVNRLSKATTAVQDGDFSVRIPVKRRDQLGQLQRSYNQMAASLEELVSTAAQKESLEKELAIARELQQNLLPSSLTTTEEVEFASSFEPSAAIGGDYFDLLTLPDERLVVVVADVSGHGLSAGLRMAMLKAALVMLVEQGLPATEVFSRLNRMVRREETPGMGRPMVTATMSTFDPKTGTLELTNAGHPPTYRIREGRSDEIELPSPPLGLLGEDYAEATIQLEPGDLVVWLSDGLIEATDEHDEPFGFERLRESLDGHPTSAAQLRDWILDAVAAHCGSCPPADDRTLVVMRYLPAVV